MEFNNDKNKKIIYFLSLVVVVSCTLLGIIILKQVKMDLELSAKVEQNITESGWPKDVPIIKSEFINITKQSEGSWSISVNRPVSYDVFRKYLLELYDEGFKPISEMGAKSPKLLSLEEPQEDGFILVWAGQNSEYIVETFWQKAETMNDSGEILEDDYVTILLYSNSDDEITSDIKDVYKDDNEDVNASGDNIFISGDNIDFSGDNVDTSGESILEDQNERKEE